MKSIIDTYTLNNGVKIPVVGFGTWQMPNDDIGFQAVSKAISAGYRHIDTAAVYGNEDTVGKAIKASGIDRKDIFVTSKLWNGAHGYEETLKAFDETFKRLDLEYLDLYLIHWPNPLALRDRWEETNAGSWKAMEELYEAGKIKAIGISNFKVHHIEALLKTAKIAPMVNQIRLCPGDTKDDVVEYCKQHNILLEAYSPFGTGKVFKVKELKDMASKYNCSVAQLSIAWSLQNGFLPIPKSVTPERIAANADLLQVDISQEDMDLIKGLVGCCGEGADSDKVPF